MKKIKLICEGSTVCNEIALHKLGVNLETKVIEATDILHALIESIKNQDEKFKEIFKDIDTIVIKNVHRLENKTGSQNQLVENVENISHIFFTSLYSGVEILDQEDRSFSRDFKDLIRSSFLNYP